MNLISDPSLSAEITVLDSCPLAEQALKGAVIARLDALIEASERSATRLFLSEINLGELFYLVAKRTGESQAEAMVNAVRQLPIEIIPVSSGAVLDASRLKARYSISYADAFCATLAIGHGAPVLTGDPDFLRLQNAGVLRVDWIGA